MDETHTQQIIDNIWKNLVRGTVDAKSPLRWATLATIDQGNPEARLIVLRKVNPTTRSCFFFTHYLSPKVVQLKQNPNCSVLFYHPRQKEQYRLKGMAKLHFQNEISQAYWQDVPDFRQFEYLGPAPGTAIDTPINEKSDEGVYFCVIEIIINTIDWLRLGRQQHQRIQFEWKQDNWSAKPLKP